MVNHIIMRDSEQKQANEMLGFGQLINEMSFIQNASSNENLLSPYMFSNNSLSPTNPNYLDNQPS